MIMSWQKNTIPKMNLCKSYNPVMQLFDQYREKYYRIVRENNDWKDRNRKLCNCN